MSLGCNLSRVPPFISFHADAAAFHFPSTTSRLITKEPGQKRKREPKKQREEECSRVSSSTEKRRPEGAKDEDGADGSRGEFGRNKGNDESEGDESDGKAEGRPLSRKGR